MEIRAAKLASGVLHGSQQGKREEMGPEARFSCVYILRGSESGRVPILPFLPPLTPSFPPSFVLLASTTPCVSGQISPTVGSAGLCGGLFILERGLPSGSLHLSKHPPGRCSVFPASHSTPTTTNTHNSSTRFIPTRLTLLFLPPSFCFITPSLRVIPIDCPSFLFLSDPLSLPHFFYIVFPLFPPSIFLVMLFLPLLLFLMIQFLLHFHPGLFLAL